MFTEIEDELFTDGFINFIIYTIVILLILKIILSFLKKGKKYVLEKRGSKQDTAIRYLFNTAKAIAYIFACTSILSNIKPMKTLGTAVLGATSILAVAVGLAAQESFGNYISGFFLAIYEPFHIGDVITLPEKNITGTVKEINFRHIVLSTVNGSTMIIPNSTMNSAVIEDKTNMSYNQQVKISVAYDTDIDKARKLIQDVVKKIEEKNGIAYNSCTVNVDELAESGITLSFFVNAKTVGTAYSIACQTREELLQVFKKEEINIPYPTTSVIIQK